VPNFGSSGTTISCTPWVALNPAIDATRAQMISCARMGWSTSLTMSAMPNGSYSVYLYTIETWNPRSYNISVQGQVVQANYDSGPSGSWRKLGPWTANVTDGTLTVSTCCGVANLSGLEVWQHTTVATANSLTTSSVSPTQPNAAPTFVPPSK
jgi:hypothetical protein